MMFRKLPLDCNLHVLSFLSPKDNYPLRTLNKISRQLLSNPLLWKNFLKDGFGFHSSEEIKNPEQKYKELMQLFEIETKRAVDYLGDKKNAHEPIVSVCKSKDPLLALLIISARLDLPILMRCLLTQMGNIDQLDQSLLGYLLRTACLFLNLQSIQTLIELGANVNGTIALHGNKIKSTCLAQVLLAFSEWAEEATELEFEKLIEKVTDIFTFLLKCSADPDAEMVLYDEVLEEEEKLPNVQSTKSIREMCLAMKNSVDQPITEIEFNLMKMLDLITSAPKLAPNEIPIKKCTF